MSPEFTQFFTVFFAERGFIVAEELSSLRFVDDVHLDSFEILSMIIELEMAFRVKISPEELVQEYTATVGGLVQLMNEKLV
jgi:acyl carrier protein